MFKVLGISFGVVWSGIGVWLLLRGPPDVRARVLSGAGTPSDAARFKKSKKVGIGFIVAGLLALLGGLLD